MNHAEEDIGTVVEALDDDVLVELAQAFTSEIKRARRVLKQAAARGDWGAIRHEAHSLSAIFAQLGAPQTGETLSRLSRYGTAAEIARFADELDDRAAPLIAAFRKAGNRG